MLRSFRLRASFKQTGPSVSSIGVRKDDLSGYEEEGQDHRINRIWMIRSIL